ncbi:DNA replication and repair protein RecF [Kytococcus aerolatus]|uniref:DNA replication and repair protein RecF n=1 Tax=Kytococcus aerolatus TaxID=592308 RepID=A0A212THB9_9MICO|nr:DNA replication/repair protein RecF [Kytococcus aerolatus]SNC65216.1 DNA replication and repair protein RecF [Kytococcus aerolatus]
MRLRHLAVRDFRSYAENDLDLQPGVTVLVGRNGQGKTNLVEAAGYLATLGSHRVSSDAPLVRMGAEHAIVRAVVERDGHETVAEIQIVPGRANRARLGRTTLPRSRELLGTLRTVLFSPEDLALVKGDPAGRRGFLDALLVARQPRWAGVQADYAQVLRQRNALVKDLRARRERGPQADALIDAWDVHLTMLGSSLLYARLRLIRDLRRFVSTAYAEVSDSPSRAEIAYRWSLTGAEAERLEQELAEGAEVPEREVLAELMTASLQELRPRELDRGITLVGPHRDELELRLGELPAKGYASHGESWSFALALRLAAFELLRTDLETDPVLVLDDVFAELDAGRRERLAQHVAGAEQVLVTAAVEEDIPESLRATAHYVDVTPGQAVARA